MALRRPFRPFRSVPALFPALLFLGCIQDGTNTQKPMAVVLHREAFGDTAYGTISKSPSLIPLPDSGFAFNFLHRAPKSMGKFRIEYRRFSARGEMVESWAHETPDTVDAVLAPIVAFPDGRQLSAWALYGKAQVNGIHARISGPGGWTEARHLEIPPTLPQTELTARALSDSVFALAYPDGERSGVRVLQCDREGKVLRSSHLAGGSERVFAPTLAPLSTGGLLVIWTEHLSVTSHLAARRLDREGNPVGGLITWKVPWMNGNWPPVRPMARPFPGGKILVVVPDYISRALLLDEEGKVLEEPNLRALEQNQDLFIDPDRGRILAIGEGETVVLLDLSMKVRDRLRLPFGIWPFGTALCETLAGHIVLAYEPEKTGSWVSTNIELLRIEGF